MKTPIECPECHKETPLMAEQNAVHPGLQICQWCGNEWNPYNPNPNPLNQPTIKLDLLDELGAGWIACQTAQPEFENVVLVVAHCNRFSVVGIGKRTSAVDPQKK